MIAIISDFLESEYLGIMKGVIYNICKNAIIVDLCNDIGSQNIKEAGWVLFKSYKFFPKNTVFLCVVDPGVGSTRKSLAIKTKNYYFVGPDNGLLYQAAVEDSIETIYEINVKNPSKTFQGRDIFAPTAAKIENGVSISALGKKLNSMERLAFHLDGTEGEVVRIDPFGNIITTIPHSNKQSYNIEINKFKSQLKFYENYESAVSEPFLIKGSSDTLEISLKNAKASDLIKAKIGDMIKIS